MIIVLIFKDTKKSQIKFHVVKTTYGTINIIYNYQK